MGDATTISLMLVSAILLPTIERFFITCVTQAPRIHSISSNMAASLLERGVHRCTLHGTYIAPASSICVSIHIQVSLSQVLLLGHSDRFEVIANLIH